MSTLSNHNPEKGHTMSTASDNQSSKEIRRQLSRFNRALERLYEVNPLMTIGVLRVLVTVALKEGQSGADITRITGFPLATVSRALLDLSVKTRRKSSEPLGLVEARPDPYDMRLKRYYLTASGQALIQSLFD